MLKFHSYPSKNHTFAKQLEPLQAIKLLFASLFILDPDVVSVRIWTHRVIIGAKAADGCYRDDVEIFGPADEMLPIQRCLQALVAEQEEAPAKPGQPMRFDRGLIDWASWIKPDDLDAALELHLEEPRVSLREVIDLAA